MKTQSDNIEREFSTPLGIVRCGFFCTPNIKAVNTNTYEKGSSEIYKTDGYKIEIISFKIKVPLYNGETLTDSLGWIFRIEKMTDFEEEIEIYCLLDKINDEVTYDIATGEHLDAIQVYNNEWTLHIGTEDGEILNSRADNKDWFPSRLKNKVDIYESITEMKKNGFITKLPDLNKGERIHIQYLTAYDKKNDQKVNTWLAVDILKKDIENWIGL
jgi:hypothetical protein